jgi:hypothetical protein
MPITINGSGTVSGLTAAPNLTSSGLTTGKVLQVISTAKTDDFSESISTGTFSSDAITLSITPSNASNKIYLLASMSLNSSTSHRTGFAFFKGGSKIDGATGDANGSRTRLSTSTYTHGAGYYAPMVMNYLDTAGGTNAITYSVRLFNGNSSTMTVGMNDLQSGSTTAARIDQAMSTFTAFEVAA